MQQGIPASAVLLAQAQAPHRPKPTDHKFELAFRVLDDNEALQRLGHLSLEPMAPEDPEDGARYAPNLSAGGLGVSGRLDALQGRALQRGDIVKMELRVGHSRARIRCLGMVAWVRVNRNSGVFRAGVGFVGVDPRDLVLAQA